MAISNVDLLKYIQAKTPQFQSLTSKITSDVFTEKGYDRIRNNDYKALNEFYGLSMRVYLQHIDIAETKDTLELAGFGETYDNPWGGIIQREAVSMVKPVSPAWKDLEDGSTVDPFVVRKGNVTERFFNQNFDFQTLLTIPDDFVMKQIFINDFGISTFIEGQIAQLRNSYAVQKYLAKKQAIDAFLKASVDTLQDSQKVDIIWSSSVTDDELISFILAVKNLVSLMKTVPTTSAYNALKFDSACDVSKLKLLIRVGFKNEIAVRILRNSFNAETLNLPVDVIEVDNFGGMEPYKEATFSTKLYPVYDKLGIQIGFAESAGQSTPTVEENAVFWKDTNENVLAILADSRLIFTSYQNGLNFETIRNPRGLYTNYFLSMPNGSVKIDNLYNAVVFNKKAGSTGGGGGGMP